MEIEDQKNSHRMQMSPAFLQSLRKLSELQLSLLKYKVEADLDNYLKQLQTSNDTDLKTLLQYANSISFSAYCPPNYSQEMYMNPYPSDWELRASLFANRKTATEGDSADKQSITSTQRVGRNDLSDMDVEDGESGTVADEETMSVITQSLFHNDTHVQFVIVVYVLEICPNQKSLLGYFRQ